MTRMPPGDRADYRWFHPLPTRWMDNDEYGHMNNATYLSLMDTALSVWQMAHGIQIRGPEALRFVFVESGVRYHAEAGFPDLIHAGLRVPQMGRTSLRVEIGLFRNDDDTACAEGHFVQVLTGDDHRPTPIPDGTRSIFAQLLVTP